MNSVAPISAKAVGERPGKMNLSAIYGAKSTNFNEEERPILSHAARLSSPVKIRLEPDTIKYQSLVANRARSATFKLRPVKPGDLRRRQEFRFKPPEATLATVQFLSPWISITKGDYRDPRVLRSDEGTSFRDIPSGLSSVYKLGESEFPPQVPSSADTPTPPPLDKTLQSDEVNKPPPTPAKSILASSASIDGTPNRSRIGTAEQSLRGDSRKSSRSNGRSSVTKRVTICSPRTGNVSESGNDAPAKAEEETLSVKMIPRRTAWQKAPMEDKSSNYYCGYLPLELSQQIAHDLHIGGANDTSSQALEHPAYNHDPHYKPLVGDRHLFLHEQFPSVPKFQLSSIEKARLDGHARLLKSRGLHPFQFSGLDDRARAYRAFAPKVNLNEAIRQRQRQNYCSKSAAPRPSRIPNNVRAMDLYDSQMKKTYELQANMRQMLKE